MFGEAPLIMVEDRESLVKTIDLLSRSPVLGVDTESDSFHHYQEKVCLIQMTANGRDVLIDPLAIESLDVLAPLFADPNRIKIFHDAGYDLVCLARDFGFDFNSFTEKSIFPPLGSTTKSLTC